MKSITLLCALACPFAFCAYPTTFPYENEAYVPPDLPLSTPSDTYDDSDPGGYVVYYRQRTLTLSDDMFPGWCPIVTGAAAHLFVIGFTAPPVLPSTFWNCSGPDHPPFSASEFIGTINSEFVCDECCTYLYGTPRYGVDQVSNWQPWLDSRASANMCSDISEEAYCILIGGDFQTNCIQHYLSPGDRLTIHLCPDGYVLNNLKCPVFMSVYTPVYAALEPEAFTSQLTAEQFITNDALMFAGDKVCHPHSYYNPTAETSSTSTPSESSTASGTDSSAANTMCFTFAIFASLLQVM